MIKDIRHKIFECRLLIGQRRLMSSLANRLINVSEVARRNGFHVYEFEANLELAKFWILSGQSQLVIGHLNEIDYLARFAADHYTLKIIGLYQIAAHIIKV